MAQTVNLRALGLNYSPNALTLPEGSLIQADDIVVRRDNTVESRRGFKVQSEEIGADGDRAKQLIEYKNRLLVHYNNKIAFDSGTLNEDGQAIYGAFAGTYSETQAGLRIKAIESNKNLYFTSSEGIKKISAKTADDFTIDAGFIRDAGVIKSLDISGDLDITQGQLSGFLPADTAVAYRVVWGYKDSNDNLLLGVPSNRIPIYNYLSDMTAMDMNALCAMLDILNQSGSLITDGDYASSFYAPVNSEAATLAANILLLAAKLDTDLKLASATTVSGLLKISAVALTSNKVTITFTTSNTTDYFSENDVIELKNLPAPYDVLNGQHTLDFSPTSTTISFTYTHADIASGAPVTGDIHSYNYQTITTTGDDVYETTLADLVVSTPPTSQDQRIINNTLYRIVERLKVEGILVISSSLQSTYVTPFTLTEAANARITITIPPQIDSQYFVQVYRTRNFVATDTQTLGGSGGIPVEPDDEMRLVYESFPTSSEISQEYMVFEDSYPEDLVENNTNLYTNPETGEGILQANEIPPFAKDINRFKNVTFYANTRTRHRLSSFQLLGVSNITSGDKVTITSVDGSDTYTFVTGVKEVSGVTCTAGSAITAGSYFEIYNAEGQKYRIWFQKNGAGSEPTQAGTICQKVSILSTDTASKVAQRVIDVVNTLIYHFQAEANTLPAIKITCINEGKTTDIAAGTSGFTVSVIQQGNGEDAGSKQILLSSLTSAAQAIDETAQSLVRVINKTSTVVSAYYISSDSTPPGQINLEAKELSETPFYVMASDGDIGGSFNPDISPIHTNITSISVANPTVVTTSAPHSLVNGDKIVICASTSTPSIDGIHTVTVPPGSTSTFTIPVNVTVSGSAGSWSKVADSAISTNEVKANRVYYSKADQPEAVPLLNYFPVGAEDKAILRIFPLRDSLFVFKEDGTYRVSGETAPFVTSLLDSSCVVIAPDSIGITGNTVYAWTLKGITPVTETGAGSEISRPIDSELQRLCSTSYTNFSKVTFGYGYDSDSSYTVFTNSAASDTYATIGFRYCTLTNTWTNVLRDQTCGLVMASSDLLHLGSATDNIIHQERKNFDRTDYSDEDFEIELADGRMAENGKILSFSNVEAITAGDVIVQEQYVSCYDFNALLIMLDKDPTVGVSTLTSTSGAGVTITVDTQNPHNLSNGDSVTLSGTDSFPSLDGTYEVASVASTSFTIQVESSLLTQATAGTVKRSYESMFEATSGANIRDKLVALAAKLDTDPALVYNDYSARIANKTGTLTSNSIADQTVVTTSTAHELIDGREITISGTQSPESVPSISGAHVINNTGTFGASTTFTLDEDVTTAGGSGLSFTTLPNLYTFNDIRACFNEVVGRLNSDTGATYTRYQESTLSTFFEAVVLSVNYRLARVTLNLPLQWVVGPVTVYKAINCEMTYAPVTMGDPLNTKQIFESTFMFATRALTNFTASFSSDLKPEYASIPFQGDGNGIFGDYSSPGFGYGFFGGASNSAPFRTIIPREAQRCRFLNVKMNHCVARETWSLYGTTLTGNTGISSRGYR
jgi:hypothetical protein